MVFTKRIGALAATALLGAGLSVAAPAAANASGCGPEQETLNIVHNGSMSSFGCGTQFGNWYGTSDIYSGSHNYGAVMLNHNGSYYNISINYANRHYYPQSTSDDAVEVWIGA
ncbi:hypothetical protein P3T37_003684 [Kitasatospora sp. MAA4]|uniref:hypothetical protein n=1 Tax=Kitasatospora sp. MAA4 TaxID=3035093 RepID=UPI0024769131|nr:hypothetical protein [Kitasatospora sp. MAA4]MDH6134282.1 hypothetical protein [Kitasatospora sp. MAA4]